MLEWCLYTASRYPSLVVICAPLPLAPLSPPAGLPQPDIVLFMDLSVDAAAQRGGFGGERYEVPEFQRAVRSRFDTMREEVRAVDPSLWRQVDASGTIDGIHAHLREVVAERIEEVQHATLRALWGGQPLTV